MPARINLFSPLPPLPSEIGNHTLLVARALAELAEVTLWTPQGEPAGPVAELPLVRFDPAAIDWPQLNRGTASIYNIGNNATFHRAIFDVARQAPGIVVLHDTRLQHFFARYGETPGADRDFYLDSMHQSHGAPALADAGRWLAGELPLDALVQRYPLAAAALAPGLAAVVHNPAERDALAGLTRQAVFHLPLACGAGPAPVRPPSGEVLRLVVFGFLGANRRLAAVLDVLAALPDRAVRLDVYGMLEEPAALHEQVAALGLGHRVACHGYVPEAVLRDALLQADLAINLRSPSMGEASASQLRIWSAGLPAIVSRTGWYATLPAGTVCYAGPEDEAAQLAAHLAAFRRDPAPYRAVGLRGRAVVVQQHTPEGYARGLLDIVAQVPALHARRAAFGLSRRATQALLALSGTRGVALGAEAVAEALGGLA